MNRILWLLLVPVLLPASAAAEAPEEAIRGVMAAAESGWNAGDLAQYMDCYWRSEDLRFASGDRVSSGWEKVLAGYRARYPDRASMGTLTFSDLDVRVLGPGAAFVFGRWRLEREGDEPHGLFTLVFRLIEKRWRIVHDHTSSG